MNATLIINSIKAKLIHNFEAGEFKDLTEMLDIYVKSFKSNPKFYTKAGILEDTEFISAEATISNGDKISYGIDK